MVKPVILALLVALSACASSTIVIRSYSDGLAAVRSTNPEMKVKAIGFAPQDPGPGRIALSRFVIAD